MAHCYWEFNCDAGTRFQIDLNSGAMNVMLMDGPNFTAYNSGNEYYFHGGYYDSTPLVLQAPEDGWWYIVVDNGDADELGPIDAYVQAL
ncbi:DUF1883 domain-containing protein [Amycolatopsis kentuckyensis]|uniref:DUF1883 domain-containing protein n=1 Tax=Amycolatopsis kentuckyensis TaxID=218823 RepID=UPI0035672D16